MKKKRKNSDDIMITLEDQPKKGWTTDIEAILLLLVLYTLQGIPIGLASTIPILLQTRKASYHDQAQFSTVVWPFSTKLLWAPIVDSVYSSSFGRRKSWLIPVQLFTAVCMIGLSHTVEIFLGEEGSNFTGNVSGLTTIFTFICFCAATQDIAVDGWALTLLSRENVGLASSCNTIGQLTGIFISSVVFLTLNSPTFCNQYIRSDPQDAGIVSLGDFVKWWGWVFLIVTLLILIFKKEKSEPNSEEGIISTYKTLWSVCKLPGVQTIVFIMLTCRIGWCTESLIRLKFINAVFHEML